MATATVGIQLGQAGIGIVKSLIGSIFAAHAAKVKAEASTLDGAFPAFRSLIASTVDAYNSGEIGAQDAINYTEQAKALYYQQVKAIERGVSPDGGVGVDQYNSPHGRFAPIDPCNGACFLAYYFVEPEAAMVAAAIGSGKSTSVRLQQVNILNGNSVPAETLQISPPVISRILPASVSNAIPAAIKSNPLVWGGLLLLGAVAWFNRK